MWWSLWSAGSGKEGPTFVFQSGCMERFRLPDSALIPLPFELKEEIEMGLFLSQLSRRFPELQPVCHPSPDSTLSGRVCIQCGLCAKILFFGNYQLFFCLPEGLFICRVSHAIRFMYHFAPWQKSCLREFRPSSCYPSLTEIPGSDMFTSFFRKNREN